MESRKINTEMPIDTQDPRETERAKKKNFRKIMKLICLREIWTNKIFMMSMP